MKSFLLSLALVIALAGLCPAQLITSTTSECGTSTDGTVVGTPNPLSPPQVSAVYTGTLPPGNYYVQEAWYDVLANTTLVSPEVQIQLTGTGEIQELPPVSGIEETVSGRNIYIGTSSGGETLQGSAPVSATYVQSVPLVNGTAVPGANTTICTVIANDSGWPTGTGYSVTLTSPAGDTIPGYPMQWQLLGPGNTINVSSGLPLYNGTVTYPTPILASPYGHDAQSIAGPLSLGNYGLTAGSVSSYVLNNVYYVSPVNSNVQAAINTVNSMGTGGTVYVYPGIYVGPTSIPSNTEIDCLGAPMPAEVAGSFNIHAAAAMVTQCIFQYSSSFTMLRVFNAHFRGIEFDFQGNAAGFILQESAWNIFDDCSVVHAGSYSSADPAAMELFSQTTGYNTAHNVFRNLNIWTNTGSNALKLTGTGTANAGPSVTDNTWFKFVCTNQGCEHCADGMGAEVYDLRGYRSLEHQGAVRIPGLWRLH